MELGTYVAEVFISYSKNDRAIAQALADDLSASGFDVWWDFQLYAGDDFHDMIRAEIAKAKAVVVIWSQTAVASKWVRGEAAEADDLGTLISTFAPGFDPRRVPLNFLALHCEPIANRARIIASIERKGATARGDAQDTGQQLAALRARVARGDAASQNELGTWYENGSGGLAKDDREAARLYKLAADQGDAEGQANLGFFYRNGRGGLTKDDREAARLYKLAADQGNSNAQTNLGFFYETGRGGLAKDDREAARLYKLAADQGNARGQANLGFFYRNGRGGLTKDDREAARLYKLAADQGDARGQINLGYLYETGRGGLAKDDREAARLYKLAADQGNAYGQDILGTFYRDGLGGLTKDDREAARLFKLAADQGNAYGQNNLGTFYRDGLGGLTKDDREAARLFKLAANQGDAKAQANLGVFYKYGRGWKKPSIILPVIATIVAAIIFTRLQSQSFQGLGTVHGFGVSSAAKISTDGKVVVGNVGQERANTFPAGAMRWSAATGMVYLRFPNHPDNVNRDNVTEGLGVSADGSVVVGYHGFGGNCGPIPPRPWSWTKTDGMVLLTGNDISVAYDANANGKVIVGSLTPCLGNGQAGKNRAAIYTKETGWESLDVLPGSESSGAYGVSADGTVVVGHSPDSCPEGSKPCQAAFRWTRQTGMVPLGFLPNATWSIAYRVSGDGTTTVGSSGFPDGDAQAVRWTAAGIEALGSLGNATSNRATHVNTDGSVVVGRSGGKAFRWTASDGMKSIEDLLTAAGVSFSGWRLEAANGVSGDGTVITGTGINPSGVKEAWIATLSRPK
jgi:TPR repeat protein/uncharacterized membrane protein